MAEPTCVIHPFSYTSPPFPSETLQQENQGCSVYGVEESVSFGRFMSENLSWERWSSFNNNRNRYVEEAKNYSRPGSVAQKKAYFEAHFKRMAALKAAAMLEQQEVSGDSGIEVNDDNENGSFFHDAKESGQNVQMQTHRSEEVAENEGVEGFVVHQNELYSAVAETEEVMRENSDVEVVQIAVDEKTVEKSQVLKGENFSWSEKKELSGIGIAQMDKPISQKGNMKDEVSAPILKKNPPLSSFISPIDGIEKGSAPLFAASPAKFATSVHPGKENYATPMKNKSSSMADPDKKRTPLRASINREFNRILSPVIRKIGSSSKTSKDCSTPLKTPANGTENGNLETPNFTKKGVRSHHDLSSRQRKPAGPRWHILSDGLKSPSNNRNKTNSPIIPTSFCLRSGERAARRKQKLEDKFNATAPEKAPQPSKFKGEEANKVIDSDLKEKAEAELNKFRHSFCFKAMSSPDHYTEAESRNKDSPKRAGKQVNTSTSQSRSSLPPRRPTAKTSSIKNGYQRNSSSTLENT